VAVIDVPKRPLTPGIRGRQFVDWLVDGRDYTATQSDPPEWAETVLSRFGGNATGIIPTADFLCAGAPFRRRSQPASGSIFSMESSASRGWPRNFSLRVVGTSSWWSLRNRTA
jgi:hypothetical protein